MAAKKEASKKGAKKPATPKKPAKPKEPILRDKLQVLLKQFLRDFLEENAIVKDPDNLPIDRWRLKPEKISAVDRKKHGLPAEMTRCFIVGDGLFEYEKEKIAEEFSDSNIVLDDLEHLFEEEHVKQRSKL